MAIGASVVQEQADSFSAASTSGSLTLASTPTAGNIIVLKVTSNRTTQGIVSLTQTNVTWQVAPAIRNNTNRMVEMWIGIVGASPSPTVNYVVNELGTLDTLRFNTQEESGVSPTATPYLTSTNQGTSTTNNSGSITPAASKNILYVVHSKMGVGGTFISGPSNSFAPLASASAGSRYARRVDASSAGTAITTDWVYTLSDTWCTDIIALLASDPQTAITVQPPSTVASGGTLTGFQAKAMFNFAQINTGFTGNAVVSIASGSGGALANATVACVAGVADLSGVTLSGAGAYTLTVTMAGMTAATSGTVTVNVPATIITAQPPTSVTSGGVLTTLAAKATTDGSTTDTAFQGNCVVTIATGTGGTVGNGTVACVNGIPNLSGVTLTGDGTYTLLLTMSGYATATTNAVLCKGANVLAAQTVITALGGDANVLGIYTPRVNTAVVSSKAATMDDILGTFSGRTPGPQIAQATAGLRPAFVGTQGSGSEYLQCTAVSTQWMASAATASFALSATTPVYIGIVYEALGDGYVGGLCADETDATAEPYANLQVLSGKHAADICFTNSATNRSAPNTNTTAVDGNIRFAVIGKDAHNSSNIDEPWNYDVYGRQIQMYNRAAVCTAGSLKLVLGRFASTYGSCKIHAVIVYKAGKTLARRLALNTWASTFGAAPDLRYGTFLEVGHSDVYGSGGTDPLSTLVPSGTTTYPYLFARLDVAGRGSLLTNGWDVQDPHSHNYGVSGVDLTAFWIPYYNTFIKPNFDGLRSGPKIVVMNILGNEIGTNSPIFSDLKLTMLQFKALTDADGVQLAWFTCADKGAGANGSNANATGTYLDGTFTVNDFSAHGILERDINAECDAHPLTYGFAVISIGSATHYIPGSRAMLNTTYYNSDKIHLTDAARVEEAALEQTMFTANQTILFPPTTGPSQYYYYTNRKKR